MELKPKDGKRWLEMVALHKAMPKSIEIPAEQWYYFYVMGIAIGKSNPDNSDTEE